MCPMPQSKKHGGIGQSSRWVKGVYGISAAPGIPDTRDVRALCLAFLHDCSHCIYFAVKVSVLVLDSVALQLTEVPANHLPFRVLRPSSL